MLSPASGYAPFAVAVADVVVVARAGDDLSDAGGQQPDDGDYQGHAARHPATSYAVSR